MTTPVFRRADLAPSIPYALGAGLFPLRIGFLLTTLSLLTLAALFLKTGIEMLHQKRGSGDPYTYPTAVP